MGQHGLRRKIHNSTQGVTLENITSSTNLTEILALDLETPRDVKVSGGYGNIFTGYFKAPADAMYRFYVTCDDGCIFYLGNGSNSMDPASKVQVFKTNGASGYRNYFTATNYQLSKWIPLNKD